MVLFIALFMIIAGGLLLWRPAMTLVLALLGAAVSVWRMKRTTKRPAAPARSAPRTASPAAVAPDMPMAANENDEILSRLSQAGWSVEPAAAPWLIATHGGVRIALRTRTARRTVTSDDVDDALAAKDREGAQYAAVISLSRPDAAVAAQARAARVQIINLPRLEAYLALAVSFPPPPPRRISA
jgi:hypothetical protein